MAAASEMITCPREVLFLSCSTKLGGSSSRIHLQRLEVEAHCTIFYPPEYYANRMDILPRLSIVEATTEFKFVPIIALCTI
jgi:hypothetical protein